MLEASKKLREILIRNRVKYPQAWEKVRRDRLGKLFENENGEVDQTSIDKIIDTALGLRFIKTCEKMVDKKLIPAIKLARFNYEQHHR